MLFNTPISALVRRPIIRIQAETSLGEAVVLLRQDFTRCLVVMRDDEVIGLFTDRDVVEKCFTSAVNADTPVSHVMDSPLQTVSPNTSIVDALHLMDHERIRHLPLVEDDGTFRGLISGRDLIEYIGEAMPEAVLNQPPAPAKPLQEREGA